MSALIQNLLIALFSVLAGALIALWIYSRSTKDLKKEAAELLKHNIMILRALENAGLAELNRDEKGNIIGFKYTIKPISGELTATGTITKVKVTRKIDSPENASD